MPTSSAPRSRTPRRPASRPGAATTTVGSDLGGEDGKRARRVAGTRARLIDVALDLYVGQGFSATTIEQIAATAGIGRSSFFRYFPSKEAVLFAPALASRAWFLAEMRARPLGESLLTSVATVCVHGDWPPMDRHDIVRSRKVLKAEPGLQQAIPQQLTSTSSELTEILRARAPHADPAAVRVIADLTFTWTTVAMTAHLRDGRPLAEHFAAVIGATCSLTADLAALPATVLR